VFIHNLLVLNRKGNYLFNHAKIIKNQNPWVDFISCGMTGVVLAA